MPFKLSEMPARKGGMREETYPFDQWLDGTVNVLIAGSESEYKKGDKDYYVSTASIRSSINGAANKRKRTVETRTLDMGAWKELIGEALPFPEPIRDKKTGQVTDPRHIVVQATQKTDSEWKQVLAERSSRNSK